MALVGGLYLFRVSGRLFGRDDDAREVKHGVPTIAEPLIESGQVGDAQLFAERRPLAPLKAIIALATFAGAIALAAFNVVPIAASAFTGVVLLILLRVISADEAKSGQIGRASGRERVGQSVEIPVVAVSLKRKAQRRYRL